MKYSLVFFGDDPNSLKINFDERLDESKNVRIIFEDNKPEPGSGGDKSEGVLVEIETEGKNEEFEHNEMVQELLYECLSRVPGTNSLELTTYSLFVEKAEMHKWETVITDILSNVLMIIDPEGVAEEAANAPDINTNKNSVKNKKKKRRQNIRKKISLAPICLNFKD